MEDVTVDQIAAQNAALAEQNRLLMERLAALEARVPTPEPEPVKGYQEFPRAMYRACAPEASGIDVPGNEVRIVNSQAELDAAHDDGFGLTPLPPSQKKNGKK